MNCKFVRYSWKDGVIAAVLSLILLLVCGAQLTKGVPNWGGDYAAYIYEGMSIADGTFEEQIVRNYIMHPSALPSEATEKSLVYVWGYPLLLSVVYRIVGFDMIQYSTVIWYKIPSLLAVSLLAGILYLFYRRFFSKYLSVFLTLIFCLNGNLVDGINSLYADVVFLFFCVLTMWIAQCLFSSVFERKVSGRTLCLSLFLGILFWCTYEIRLNGGTIILVIALSYIIGFFCQRETRPSWKQILAAGMPYLVFVLMKWLSEAILLPATSNVSDVGAVTMEVILNNARYYCNLTKDYLRSLLTGIDGPAGIILCFLAAVGFAAEGWKPRNLHFSCLLLGTYAVLIVLPYTEGIRYLFNVLPILLLFLAYGAVYLYGWIAQKMPWVQKGKGILLAIGILLCLTGSVIPAACDGIANIKNNGEPMATDIYSPDAIAAYQYIQEHTDEDAMIAFHKPRIIFLNTGRISFRSNANGHVLEEADYYLSSKYVYGDYDREVKKEAMELVYHNDTFSLYKLP